MTLSANDQVDASLGQLRVDPVWAWEPFVPTPNDPWDLRKVGHLFRRAAFAGSWPQLQQALEEGPEKTVSRLTTPPPKLAQFHQQFDPLLREAARGQGQGGIRAWWLRRMVESPFPLEEKLTLFWHGHFAISADRLRDPTLFVDYLLQLRESCLSSWQNVLATVCGHPALLLSAGSPQHRKAQPSLKWARIFAAQVGLAPDGLPATELQEIARAWTGWFVVNNRLRFIASEHDPRPKKILGRQGDFGIPELVAVISAHPASQEFVVRKLFRYFISEEHPPSGELLSPLVDCLAQGESLLGVVRVILRSNIFYSTLAYRSRVKSPVESVVGLARMLGQIVPTARLGEDLVDLGQDLCNPPTFDGWPEGRAWINHLSFLRRKQVLRQLAVSSALDPWAVAQKHGYGSINKLPDFLSQLIYQGDLPSTTMGTLQQKWNSLSASRPFQPADGAKVFLAELVQQPEFELA
ncbi:MAG: DUF1800 domain-containing protein [Thermoguttaceae bacterium]|nr:DUF1800 domain-containing protein [Thermoguttaceae bacterium]MDW8079845.1 DUF1800 family protein [Thermoguttaceae bacterium]